MVDVDPPTLQDVFRARKRVAGMVRRTPLMSSPGLAARVGAPVLLKDETFQPTGSFKVRGAANKLLSLPADLRRRGVVAVSTGNHGRAVAHVASELGVRATVCVSTKVPDNKLKAIRALGARLVVHGDSQDEAENEAKRLVEEDGLTYIPPFDDPDIVAGQGTIGLEILEELPDVDTVVVPLSGGGLIAGIALALKAANPAIRVLGVSMERGAAMEASLRAGMPVPSAEVSTLADSLQGGIGLRNRITFDMVRKLVDDVILVSENAIARAMRFAFDQHRLVLEGGGAVAVAAVLEGAVEPRSEDLPIVLVASGGNVGLDRFLEIVRSAADPSSNPAATAAPDPAPNPAPIPAPEREA